MPWRVFPWDPQAKAGAPFSPQYVQPGQGSGRFDVPGAAVIYLAESAAHAVAEKLQRFRGQRLERYDLIESGHTLALVECSVPAAILGKVIDLCDPQALVKLAIGPDVLASRDVTKTQQVSKQVHDQGSFGLRWWSALSGDWHTVVLFMDRVAEGDLRYVTPVQLTVAHPVVKEASAALGIRI